MRVVTQRFSHGPDTIRERKGPVGRRGPVVRKTVRMEDTIDVVIEIPRGSRNKYEVDHRTGQIRLDRRLFSATTYPTEYGFIPDTLSYMYVRISRVLVRG